MVLNYSRLPPCGGASMPVFLLVTAFVIVVLGAVLLVKEYNLVLSELPTVEL